MIRSITVTLAAAFLAAVPLTAQNARWVAPVYPGAIDGGERGVFLSRASPERVIAFYEARVGAGTPAGESVPWIAPYARPRKGDTYWIVVSFDEARGITGESLSENMTTTPAGVLVRGPIPQPRFDPDQPVDVRAVGGYFDRLESFVRLGTLQRSEIQPLIRKYLPLATMHYPRVERNGRQVPLYEAQEARCGDEILGGQMVRTAPATSEEDLEAMQERMQALLAAGEVQAAMQLQQQIMAQAMAGRMSEAAAEAGDDELPTLSSAQLLEKFDACLEELAQNAYPTLITISTHPSQW